MPSVEPTRLSPLAADKRCGLASCWCNPPAKDYGTHAAEGRLVPRMPPAESVAALDYDEIELSVGVGR